jgi:SAM-dependent methyltransferase
MRTSACLPCHGSAPSGLSRRARNNPKMICLVRSRKPLEHGVFEDEESVRRYTQGLNLWMPRLARSFAAIVKEWDLIRGRALDLGCGTGFMALELAKAFPEFEFVGLDLSEAAVRAARVQVADSEVAARVSFEQGDAEQMPFDDGSFDLVVSTNTLHLLDNPISMFDEVHRVLSPSGRFIISDFRRSWWGALTPHIRAAYTPSEIEDLLRHSKLENWAVQNGLLWLTVLSKA